MFVLNVLHVTVSYLNTKFLILSVKIRLFFYIPTGLKDADEVRELEKSIVIINSSYTIEVNKNTPDLTEETKIKPQFLRHFSYIRLVIFKDKTVPLTFYTKPHGKEGIRINEFLVAPDQQSEMSA